MNPPSNISHSFLKSFLLILSKSLYEGIVKCFIFNIIKNIESDPLMYFFQASLYTILRKSKKSHENTNQNFETLQIAHNFKGTVQEKKSHNRFC